MQVFSDHLLLPRSCVQHEQGRQTLHSNSILRKNISKHIRMSFAYLCDKRRSKARSLSHNSLVSCGSGKQPKLSIFRVFYLFQNPLANAARELFWIDSSGFKGNSATRIREILSRSHSTATHSLELTFGSFRSSCLSSQPIT